MFDASQLLLVIGDVNSLPVGQATPELDLWSSSSSSLAKGAHRGALVAKEEAMQAPLLVLYGSQTGQAQVSNLAVVGH